MAVRKTIGVTLTKTMSGAEIADTVIPRLSTIGGVGVESEELETTALDSTGGFREFIGSLKDAGELDLNGFVDEDHEDDFALLLTLANSQKAEEWTIEFLSGAKWVFNGWIKMIRSTEATIDGLTGFEGSIRITGQPVFTPHA